MISISKEEAKIMREKIPNVNIVRTMKQKSKRGHYYCEETKRATRFLENLRNGNFTDKKAGAHHK